MFDSVNDERNREEPQQTGAAGWLNYLGAIVVVVALVWGLLVTIVVFE